MLFDCNASVGHWPFRAHRTRTADDLVARLDELGVGRALVGSLSAVCYRDTQAGNDELLEALAPHAGRLTPVAVLNPTYAGWERDLDDCAARGCVGLRLYPNYHRYELTGPDGKRIIAAAAERGLVLCFVCRHEDRRQRHWLDTPEDITLAEIIAGLAPFPQAKLLVLDSLGVEGSALAQDPAWRDRPFAVDISRMAVVLQQSVGRLAQSVGWERLVFGTGLPLKGPHTGLLKLELLPEDVKPGVGGGNLRRLLGEVV